MTNIKSTLIQTHLLRLRRKGNEKRVRRYICERLTLPEFTEPCPLAVALENFQSDRQLLVCAERGEAMPLNELLHEPEAEGISYAFLCGPEGGFSQTELDGFAKLSFIRFVSLGPRILRAETAALSAVACWQAALGDWRRRPPA